jgi:hypothetical protein
VSKRIFDIVFKSPGWSFSFSSLSFPLSSLSFPRKRESSFFDEAAARGTKQ